MTPKKEFPGCRPRGRPPAFDRSIALSQAMTLFWDRGYEGTSFDDLIAAMGISASSFYNSFTSKEALYVEVIEAYRCQASIWFTEALAHQGSTRQAFAALFEAAAVAYTRRDRPAGCMISVAATQCSPAQARLRQMLIDQRHMVEKLMAERLQLGVERGDVPQKTDCAGLAACFSALLNGMGIQARDGAEREKLRLIGQISLDMLPDSRAWSENLATDSC